MRRCALEDGIKALDRPRVSGDHLLRCRRSGRRNDACASWHHARCVGGFSARACRSRDRCRATLISSKTVLGAGRRIEGAIDDAFAMASAKSSQRDRVSRTGGKVSWTEGAIMAHDVMANQPLPAMQLRGREPTFLSYPRVNWQAEGGSTRPRAMCWGCGHMKWVSTSSVGCFLAALLMRLGLAIVTLLWTLGGRCHCVSLRRPTYPESAWPFLECARITVSRLTPPLPRFALIRPAVSCDEI